MMKKLEDIGKYETKQLNTDNEIYIYIYNNCELVFYIHLYMSYIELDWMNLIGCADIIKAVVHKLM